MLVLNAFKHINSKIRMFLCFQMVLGTNSINTGLNVFYDRLTASLKGISQLLMRDLCRAAYVSPL